MQTEILIDAEPLEEEWWDLWLRDPAATPFQSPAWLLPWRRHFQEGESVIISLRESGRLMGLVPLFRLGGRLLLWGAGTSDRLDGLFDPALDRDSLHRALALLDAPLDLFQLPARSPLMCLPVPDGWEDRRGLSESCAVIGLPARPGKKMRQNLRYYRRQAEDAGIGEPVPAGASNVRQLAELHTRRWNGRGEPGVFADPRFLAWQEDAAALLERAGMLCLYTLFLGGRIAAALYVLKAKGKAYYYIGGFDPEHAGLGLGTVLIGHAIAEAERSGFSAFDFLRGQEDYKYRWGAVDEPTHARHLRPATGKGSNERTRNPLDHR